MFELNNSYWDHCSKKTKPLANLSKFIHGCTTATKGSRQKPISNRTPAR